MSDPISLALNDKTRPRTDRSRDIRDHSEEMVRFGRVGPGAVVADFLPFRGYWTRLFSSIVGDTGQVYPTVPSDLLRVERIAKGKTKKAARGSRAGHRKKI